MGSLDGSIFVVKAVGVCRVCRVPVKNTFFVVFIGHIGDANANIAVLVLADMRLGVHVAVNFLFIFIRALKYLQSVRNLRLVKTLRITYRT